MSFSRSHILLRRGKPRPPTSLFPDRFARVPMLHKPMQGGQHMFNTLHLRTLDAKIRQETMNNQNGRDSGFSRAGGDNSNAAIDEEALGAEADGELSVKLPQADFAESRAGTEDALEQEMKALMAQDGFVRDRSFNELKWYEQRNAKEQNPSSSSSSPSDGAAAIVAAPEPDGTMLPERIVSNDYFQSRFGYSLLKETELSVTPDYGQLDLWAELPKYTRNMYFLYIISRRRNTFAVCFDYDGKKMLKTYTVGNRGLKNTDKGYSGEGSIDNGHQVASMYLNDLLPKIRESRASTGAQKDRSEKIEIVLRLMGFYNGRQGAVRAVNDRQEFVVRYVEDVTPFPMNGPKMPRGVYK